MEDKKTSFWITYRDPESYPTASDAYGKWVCTFSDRSGIARICQDAVAEHIVPESKYTDADAGQCCFCLNLSLIHISEPTRQGESFTIPDLKRSDP